MTTKHTPGPWTYGRVRLGQGFAEWIVTAIHHERGRSNVLIAGDTQNHTPSDEAEANARLIAAAPDLLEAVRDMISDHGDLSEATLAFARAALAKAVAES